jgi:hypothetical protein
MIGGLREVVSFSFLFLDGPIPSFFVTISMFCFVLGRAFFDIMLSCG